MWCEEIIRLFNNNYNLNLSIQRAEFFHEVLSNVFRFEISNEEDDDEDEGECTLQITRLEENVETEYEMDRFIFWFHTVFFRDLRNELDALNNQNNDFDDIVYRVESMERVIDSFKYLEKIDDFEDFFESMRIYIENVNY
tara:strand:- start:2875 stop:3294 length:420 start_codon:yes stop_codon:yes gene_type:complete